MLDKTILVIAVVFLAAVACYAAETTETNKPSPVGVQISATIDNLEAQAKSITLRFQHEGKEQTRVYAYNDQTAFWSGARKINADQLKPGNQVTVDVDNASMTINRLELVDKPKPKE